MIVTPLDSATLDSKEHYVFYHKMVKHALNKLLNGVEHQGLLNEKEQVLLKQYTDLLLYSVEAMRVKYMYDEDDNMKVDLTDSGFPNYLEFRYLYNDLELRTNYINKLESIPSLKEEFLDTLLKKKQPIKKSRLFQAASTVYYSSVKQQYIFNRFVQGKIVKAPKSIKDLYMTSWSFYDVSTNRPYVCFMYFDCKSEDPSDYKEAIYEVLKESADREMPLDMMAHNIDRKLKDVYPKHIKRIDLGPFHNVFAKDENEITHAVLEGIGNKEVPLESFAISFSIDKVSSGADFKEGSFFNKIILQKWNDVERDKYIFAPHRVIQLLHMKSQDYLDTLAKQPLEVDDLKIENI